MADPGLGIVRVSTVEDLLLAKLEFADGDLGRPAGPRHRAAAGDLRRQARRCLPAPACRGSRRVGAAGRGDPPCRPLNLFERELLERELAESPRERAARRANQRWVTQQRLWAAMEREAISEPGARARFICERLWPDLRPEIVEPTRRGPAGSRGHPRSPAGASASSARPDRRGRAVRGTAGPAGGLRRPARPRAPTATVVADPVLTSAAAPTRPVPRRVRSGCAGNRRSAIAGDPPRPEPVPDPPGGAAPLTGVSHRRNAPSRPNGTPHAHRLHRPRPDGREHGPPPAPRRPRDRRLQPDAREDPGDREGGRRGGLLDRGAGREAGEAARGLDHGPGRRRHRGPDRGAARAPGAGRHDHRRRQHELPRRRPAPRRRSRRRASATSTPAPAAGSGASRSATA